MLRADELVIAMMAIHTMFLSWVYQVKKVWYFLSLPYVCIFSHPCGNRKAAAMSDIDLMFKVAVKDYQAVGFGL